MQKKNKRLKKTIHSNMYKLTLSLLLIVTTILLGLFFYIFEQQVKKDVKVITDAYANVLNFSENNIELIKNNQNNQMIRITIIDENGNVEFDSQKNANEIGNHADRPEIQNAFRTGAGEGSRFSATTLKETYYYAVKLNNNSVLRVSQTVKNIYYLLPQMFIIIFLIIIVFSIINHFLSKKLTKNIVDPINKIDLYNNENEIYAELMPFVQTFRVQQKHRQNFSANVSHELKTPLTTISGYAEMIETGMVPEENIPFFSSKIHKEATRMLVLIDDIIRLSELDQANIESLCETIQIKQIAYSVFENLKFIAKQKNIQITLNCQEIEMFANPTMIEELIYNLTENAIKYNNDNGNVEINIEENSDSVLIQIIDDGIGIPEIDKHRIFERFYRVDKSRSKKTGGTGLGLAIVKHIVQSHKGSLEVESIENVGTKITAIIPKELQCKL